MISIRRRLLTIQLAVFAGAWAIVTAVTYFESQHEFEELFDAQLSQEAGILAELTLETLKSRSIGPRVLSREIYGHKYERYISFQIWESDQLRLRSHDAPESRLAENTGFVDRKLDGVQWRVFGLRDKNNQYTILAAESYHARNELIEEITLGTLVPLLVALPLVTLLLWVGIGRGLAPLDTVAQEVSRRSSSQLEIIPEADVPAEVLPLIHSLNGLFHRLAQAFEAERRFTADASHEMRTPLASIKTQAQVALREVNNDVRAQVLKNIVSGVDRCASLVEQMLTLARLDPAMNHNGIKQSVNLIPQVQNVLAGMEPLACDNGVMLVFDAQEGVSNDCCIRAYASAIDIMVRNLVENAIHYSPSGAEVKVSLRAEAGNCLLSVEDRGEGIPEVDRERVFDAFYRRPGQEVNGSGLGLAIVRKIVDLHDAEISYRFRGGWNGNPC